MKEQNKSYQTVVSQLHIHPPTLCFMMLEQESVFFDTCLLLMFDQQKVLYYQGSGRLQEREETCVLMFSPHSQFLCQYDSTNVFTLQLKFILVAAVDSSWQIFQPLQNEVYCTPSEILAPAHWCSFPRGLCPSPMGSLI